MDFVEMVNGILNGEGLEVTEFHLVPEQKKPVNRKNICFAVCAVIFNSKNEVLMVQEAKAVCRGLWYLPAGRMEDGETIVDALKREVQEEAGIDCRPITLLQIQEKGPNWIRFVFLAEKTGGSLKTLEQKNAESLQAQWYDRDCLPSNIRKHDILTLIDAGINYRQSPWFNTLLPVDLPCHVICQRLLLVFISSSSSNCENSDEQRLWLLLSDNLKLPVGVSVEAQTLAFTPKKLLKACMPSSYDQLSVNTCGILGLQHNGKFPGKTDGVCLNTLVVLEFKEGDEKNISTPLRSETECFTWHEVTNQSLKTKIIQRIQEGSVLPVQCL